VKIRAAEERYVIVKRVFEALEGSLGGKSPARARKGRRRGSPVAVPAAFPVRISARGPADGRLTRLRSWLKEGGRDCQVDAIGRKKIAKRSEVRSPRARKERFR